MAQRKKQKNPQQPIEEAKEIGCLIEQILVHLNHRRYASARREAEALLHRWPEHGQG